MVPFHQRDVLDGTLRFVLFSIKIPKPRSMCQPSPSLRSLSKIKRTEEFRPFPAKKFWVVKCYRFYQGLDRTFGPNGSTGRQSTFLATKPIKFDIFFCFSCKNIIIKLWIDRNILFPWMKWEYLSPIFWTFDLITLFVCSFFSYWNFYIPFNFNENCYLISNSFHFNFVFVLIIFEGKVFFDWYG